jgi:methanogenic corrinoid protein MtbC1
LWQTGTITPAHEHFVSYLIKQKLASNTERLELKEEYKDNRTYIMFLPLNEIHELGLMFINYELLAKGYKAIFLGESVPVSSLTDVKNYFHDITFITYLTVEPQMEDVSSYVETLKSELIDESSELLLFGKNSKYVREDLFDERIKTYATITEFTDNL